MTLRGLSSLQVRLGSPMSPTELPTGIVPNPWVNVETAAVITTRGGLPIYSDRLPHLIAEF